MLNPLRLVSSILHWLVRRISDVLSRFGSGARQMRQIVTMQVEVTWSLVTGKALVGRNVVSEVGLVVLTLE